MSHLSLWAFGTPRLARGGDVISMDTRKALALLTYLALNPQHQSRDALATLLWSENDQAHARAALRRTLSTLTKALGDSVLVATRETICLRERAPLRVDVAEFHSLIARVHAHAHPPQHVCASCRDDLTAAIALYTADFLDGFALRDSPVFDDWQRAHRETLRRSFAHALEQLIRTQIAAGDLGQALPYARRWLALDVLNEQAHRFLMRLYAWTGQRSEALQQYRECARLLDRELGVAPLEATSRLYEAIKHRQLAPPPTPRPAQAQSEASPPLAPEAVVPQTTAPARPAARSGPLVGRDNEWMLAQQAYQASAHSGHVLVLEGEAGIGKTRLAEELAQYARDCGGVVTFARCYEGEANLAYAPILAALRSATMRPEQPTQQTGTWLAEAARLLPELRDQYPDLPSAAPQEGAGAQARFFEGLRHTLLDVHLGGPAGVLILDDLHWADSATLDVLAYLMRRLAEYPVCLVLTWRSDEVPLHHRLRHVVAEVQRAGVCTHVALHRLAADDVRRWVGLEASTTDGIAERICAETEGIPFFVAEYVRALATGVLAGAEPTWAVPGGVQDLLHSRVRRVGETGMQVLATAALLGRSFDFETVRAVSGRSPEETLAALEDLAAHGMIAELGDGPREVPRYDFTHDKLRTLVLEQTSLARRRLLHARAVAALAGGLRTHGNAALAGQVAQHALGAGDSTAAATYFKQAGDYARAVYANAEALRHYQQAHALGYTDAAAIHEALGDMQTLLGEYTGAVASYEVAAASAAPNAAWRTELKLGQIYARRGEWDATESHLNLALAALDASTTPAAGERAAIFAEWSLIARSRGQLAEAQARAASALELAQHAQNDRALAQVHNLLGMLARSQGDAGAAVCHLERSLALAERDADPGARAAALNNLALALGESAEWERARAAAEAALALCSTQGDRHHEAALHNNLADLLHAAGDAEAAMGHLKRAVAIYAEIGVEAGMVQPGIWKLADW